jgi:hypothetical protein
VLWSFDEAPDEGGLNRYDFDGFWHDGLGAGV